MKCSGLALLLAFVTAFAACTGAGKRADAELQAAKAALDAGQLESARHHAEVAYEATPEDPSTRETLAQVHRTLAELHLSGGEFGGAADAMARAADLEPYRQKRAADWFRAWQLARDAGRERATIAPMLTASLEADPSDMQVRRAAATAFDELGDVDTAINHYLWVWEADRSLIPVGLRLGALYSKRGDLDDAAAIFRRVLDSQPDNVQARLRLAEVYESSGRSSRARTMYRELQKDHPDNAMILFRYADFLEQVGDREHAERLRARARGELPGVERREMRDLPRHR